MRLKNMTRDIEQHKVTQPITQSFAPGRPGAQPHWSSGAKTAVGTAMSMQNRVWFTVSKGTLNEL